MQSVKIWHDKACLRHFISRFPCTISAPRARSTDACSGVPEGRSSGEWVDFDFFGHQLVTHLDPTRRALHFNEVDGKDVPVPHFGVVLEWEDWHELAARLREATCVS